MVDDIALTLPLFSSENRKSQYRPREYQKVPYTNCTHGGLAEENGVLEITRTGGVGSGDIDGTRIRIEYKCSFELIHSEICCG